MLMLIHDWSIVLQLRVCTTGQDSRSSSCLAIGITGQRVYVPSSLHLVAPDGTVHPEVERTGSVIWDLYLFPVFHYRPIHPNGYVEVSIISHVERTAGDNSPNSPQSAQCRKLCEGPSKFYWLRRGNWIKGTFHEIWELLDHEFIVHPEYRLQ